MNLRRMHQSARYVLGATMLAAGIGKLLASNSEAIAPMVLPDSLVGIGAVLERQLPFLELLLAALLLSGCASRLAAIVSLAMGVGFVCVAGAIPEGVQCGCFGMLGSFESATGHLVVALGVVVTAALAVPVASTSTGRGTARPRTPSR